MQSKALTLTAVLALALLAGCSDAPPAGTLVAADAGLAVEGSTSNSYTAASAPASAPTSPPTPLCPPPQTPQLPQCVEASTTIHAHFMTLREPDGNGYAIYATGTGGEKQLGPIAESNGMYDFNYTVNEDYSALYQNIELRMGDFTLATASAAAGTQAFALAAGVNGVTVTGTFKAKTLTVDVAGLPDPDSSYVGRLYTMGEDGNLTVARTFDIVAGANTYEDEDANIGDYAEFHIHVGNSLINLYKGTITPK